MSPRRPRLTFQPLTPDRWPDLEQLFGKRGACGGCWCMAWRLRRSDWEAGKGEPNRRAFQQLVHGPLPPGVLAYSGIEPVGWCAIAPRTDYITLEKSRILAAVDEQPVWSISCLFVARPFRRHGISARLIEAAARFARTRGAKIVEGYPVVPYTAKVPDVFAWTGLVTAFQRAGFREVARRSKSRPIMRRHFGRVRTKSR